MIITPEILIALNRNSTLILLLIKILMMICTAHFFVLRLSLNNFDANMSLSRGNVKLLGKNYPIYPDYYF
jgi:hypothetical protein